MSENWKFKVYHNFLIATPVITILSVIAIVYFGYVFTFCIPLIYSNKENFSFSLTSSLETAYSKGLSLFIILTIFTIMLMINLLRTVFMDPGYFKSPLEVEKKIIHEHACVNDEQIEKIKPFIEHYSKKRNRKDSESVKDNYDTNDKDTINFLANDIQNKKIHKFEEKKDDRESCITIDDIDQKPIIKKANYDSNDLKEDTMFSDNLNRKELNLAKKIKFMNSFDQIIENYPLTYSETVKMREKITTLMKESDFKEDNMKLYNTTIDKDKENVKAHVVNNLENKSISIESNIASSNVNSKEKKIESSSNSNIIAIGDPAKNDEYIVNKKNEINIWENFKDQELYKTNLCMSCIRKKIERSHHCRMCSKCVLKMDHHCPWLANCIGFRNYKYFLLVQFYGLLATVLVIFTYWEPLINYLIIDKSSTAICWFSGYVYLCNFGLFLFLLWLSISNWSLAFKNITVIENADRERFPSTKSLNIYDLGFYKNFCSVFGKNPLVWFLPFGANYDGEGYIYETIYKPNLFKIE